MRVWRGSIGESGRVGQVPLLLVVMSGGQSEGVTECGRVCIRVAHASLTRAPIADFLNIPPPAHPPEDSPTLEGPASSPRPRPPQRKLPPLPAAHRPPQDAEEEPHYEEARPPPPNPRPSKTPNRTGALTLPALPLPPSLATVSLPAGVPPVMSPLVNEDEEGKWEGRGPPPSFGPVCPRSCAAKGTSRAGAAPYRPVLTPLLDSFEPPLDSAFNGQSSKATGPIAGAAHVANGYEVSDSMKRASTRQLNGTSFRAFLTFSLL